MIVLGWFSALHFREELNGNYIILSMFILGAVFLAFK